MATGEDQLQSFVGNRHVVLGVGRERLEPVEQRRLLAQPLFPTDAVDRSVARRRDEPGRGIRRRSGLRPAPYGDCVGVLECILGEIEVA
jgi:hypothetical protein